MKSDLLSYFPAVNHPKVEPLISEVFSFYGNIELSFSDNAMSEFLRDVDSSSYPLKPKGKIVIAKSNNIETALVHELLHLAIALKHKAYALYFPGNFDGKFISMLQNVVEHDLIINDFIALGYPKSKFLFNSYFPVDYKKEKLLNEPKPYWLFEYLRLTINLNVIDEKEKDTCRQQITKMKKIAIDKFPGIDDDFRIIREWHNSKRFHDFLQYPLELKRLFEILKEPKPSKYLIPHPEGYLTEKII